MIFFCGFPNTRRVLWNWTGGGAKPGYVGGIIAWIWYSVMFSAQIQQKIQLRESVIWCFTSIFFILSMCIFDSKVFYLSLFPCSIQLYTRKKKTITFRDSTRILLKLIATEVVITS